MDDRNYTPAPQDGEPMQAGQNPAPFEPQVASEHLSMSQPGQQEPPVYQPQQTVYEPQQPTFEPQQAAYEPQQPTFEPQQAAYEPQQPTYEPQQTVYEPRQTACELQPTYPPQQAADEPQQTTYEPQQTAYEPQQTAYEPQQVPYATQQTAYDAQNPVYGAQAAPPPKKKKSGRGWAIGLASVAAACLLFAGGAALGGLFTDGGADAPVADAAFGSDNMPTVSIAGAPEFDPDNYDVVNGLAGEEIYKKVNPSIVSVIATNMDGSGGTGSGVIMTEDGYIITNNHVVVSETTGAAVDKVIVQLDNGTQLDARIVGRDEKTDLAVLKVDPDSALTAAEFGDSDELQPGEYAYALGSPGGVELANTITGGRISAINRDITIDDRVMTLIQTDASINPGNSGGALINKFGQVVGITSAKLGISYYEGLGFAIPMNTVKDVVDELIATGYVAGRPSIGITGYNVSEQTATASNVPQGVYVVSVDERAAAYNEGLQPKDIITAVDGQTITTMDEINEVKEAKKAGETIEIRVYRMSTGRFVDLTITLTDEHDLEGEVENEQSSYDPYYGGYDNYGDDGYSQYDDYDDPFSHFFNW